jgi:hypothetical protein
MKEARLRQAQKDQAVQDILTSNEEKKQAKAKADYMRWEEECDSVFGDKASMIKFPFPPLPRRIEPKCPGFLKITVPTCQHTVKQCLIEMTGSKQALGLLLDW